MVANEPAQDHIHARTDMARRDIDTRDDITDSRCIDEDSICAAPAHDLRITGHDIDPGLLRRKVHRMEDFPQIRQGKALFQDEPHGQIARHGARHRQIVDRAADRELADIAAGEKERLYNVGIRRKGRAPGQLDGRAVMQLVEQRIAEFRQNIFFDQRMAEAAARTMRHCDYIIFHR